MQSGIFCDFGRHFCCWARPLPPALGQSRVALVTGNSAYRHTAPLPNPRRDAAAVSFALRSIDFEATERLDQDRSGKVNALRDFGARANGGDDYGPTVSQPRSCCPMGCPTPRSNTSQMISRGGLSRHAMLSK